MARRKLLELHCLGQPAIGITAIENCQDDNGSFVQAIVNAIVTDPQPVQRGAKMVEPLDSRWVGDMGRLSEIFCNGNADGRASGFRQCFPFRAGVFGEINCKHESALFCPRHRFQKIPPAAFHDPTEFGIGL